MSYNIFILFQSADVKNATKNMSLYVLLKPYEPQNVTSEQTSVNKNQYKATPIVKKKSPFVTASQLIGMSTDCEVVEGVTNKQSKDKTKSKGQKSVTSFFKSCDKKVNKEVGLKLDDLNNTSKKSVDICEKSIFELSDGDYEPYIPVAINGHSGFSRKTASSSNSDYDQESESQPEVVMEVTDKFSELDDKQLENDAKKANNSQRKNKASKNKSVYFDIDDIFGQSPSECAESKSPNISDYPCNNLNDVNEDCSENEQDHFQKPTEIGMHDEVLMNNDLKKLENTVKEVKNNYKHRKRKLMEDIFGQVEHEASSTIPTKRLKSLDEHEITNKKIVLESKEKNINVLKKSRKPFSVDPVKVYDSSPSPSKRKNSPNKRSEVISYDPTNSSVKRMSVADKPNDLKIKSPSKKEQVSDTVIKYLMPFYKQKMIGDKDLFKHLARAIVHQVILGNQLPGESS